MTQPTFILASELDGTLLPPDQGVAGKPALLEFSSRFGGQHEIALAYVTSRHLTLALDAIHEFNLPKPEVLSCDVGTTLYRRKGESYELDGGYRAFVKESLGGRDGGFLRRGLRNSFPLLRVQEFDRQGEFKLSYYLEAGTNFRSVVDSIRHILGRVGARVDVVFSVDAVSGHGLLDILPAGVSKASAIERLASDLGVVKDHVVYAGDSGNDPALLSGFRTIVVGNVPQELKDQARQSAGERGLASRLYLATEPYAGGVLEGCGHFGLISRQ